MKTIPDSKNVSSMNSKISSNYQGKQGQSHSGLDYLQEIALDTSDAGKSNKSIGESSKLISTLVSNVS